MGTVLGMMLLFFLYWPMCRPGYDVPDLKSVNDDALLNGGQMEQCEAEVTYTSVTGPIDYSKNDN